MFRQEHAEAMMDDAGAEGVAQFEEVGVFDVDEDLAVVVGAVLVLVHEKQSRSQI